MVAVQFTQRGPQEGPFSFSKDAFAIQPQAGKWQAARGQEIHAARVEVDALAK